MSQPVVPQSLPENKQAQPDNSDPFADFGNFGVSSDPADKVKTDVKPANDDGGFDFGDPGLDSGSNIFGNFSSGLDSKANNNGEPTDNKAP